MFYPLCLDRFARVLAALLFFLVGICYQKAAAATEVTGRSNEIYFRALDGERFSWERWIPTTATVKAIMIAIPGMGGAASEIGPLGEVLQQKGIAVYAPNLRGQGLDPVIKRRGRELNVDQLLSDARTAMAEIQQKHPNAPVWLYGESMGALLVVQLLCAKNPIFSIKGAILATPVVALANPPSPVARKLIRFAATYFPSLRISPERFKKHAFRFSHDPAKQQFLENAPYRIRKFTASFLNNLSLLMTAANHAAEQIQQPILVLAAGDDDYINPKQIHQWIGRIASSDKILVLFPDSYHRLLFDRYEKEVTKTISEWLIQRL